MPPVCVCDISVLIFIFTVISWSEGVLNQLDNATRSRFPYLEVCLRFEDCTPSETERTWKQHSSSAVMKQVREQHGESYLNNLQMHLSHCRDFKTSAER